jgi:hypothetical protein
MCVAAVTGMCYLAVAAAIARALAMNLSSDLTSAKLETSDSCSLHCFVCRYAIGFGPLALASERRFPQQPADCSPAVVAPGPTCDEYQGGRDQPELDPHRSTARVVQRRARGAPACPLNSSLFSIIDWCLHVGV